MRKKAFLKQLKNELDSLPDQEINDIISDYEEYFSEGKRHKRSEEDIAKGLGSPKKLAKHLKAEYHVKAAKKDANARNIIKAVFATISLGLFNLIIVLGPLVAVMSVFIALYAVILSLWVSSLAIFIAAIIVLVAGPALLGLSGLFAAIALGAITTLLFFFINWMGKYFLKFLTYYLKMNVRIIRGESK